MHVLSVLIPLPSHFSLPFSRTLLSDLLSLVHCHLLGRFLLLTEGGGCLFLNTLWMQELILLIWWGILVQTAVPKCLRLSGLNNKIFISQFLEAKTSRYCQIWCLVEILLLDWYVNGRVEASSHVSPYNGTNLIHEDFNSYKYLLCPHLLIPSHRIVCVSTYEFGGGRHAVNLMTPKAW